MVTSAPGRAYRGNCTRSYSGRTMNRQEMIESTLTSFFSFRAAMPLQFAVSFGREMTSVSSWHFCAVPPVLNPAESLPESNLGSRALRGRTSTQPRGNLSLEGSADFPVPGNLLRVGVFQQRGPRRVFNRGIWSLWFCCGYGFRLLTPPRGLQPPGYTARCLSRPPMTDLWHEPSRADRVDPWGLLKGTHG